MTFQPSGGTATVKFEPQKWANSPICSCNGGWRGIELPVDQFDLGVAGGNPWSLEVGPMDHSVPANWWQDPESDFLSSFSLTIKRGERTIYKIDDAPAGITLESSGPRISVFTDRSQFSAVMPADGSTTKLQSDPTQMDGEPGGVMSMAISSPTVPSQQSDYVRSGAYVQNPENVGSNFRATMIDTLGPTVRISLGELIDGSEPRGTYRLWVGGREITLPAIRNIELVIRTDFAIRFRPLPFDHRTIVGDGTASTMTLPLITRSIPGHQVIIDNAVGLGGAAWTSFVKRATTGGGAPISLPPKPTVSIYGLLGTIKSSALVGTILSPNSAEIAAGDLLQLKSTKGFDFTQKAVALLAATSEGGTDTQYVHGQATGRLTRADAPDGVDGLLDRLRGSSVTKTEWLIHLAQALVTVAGTITVLEVFQVFFKRDRDPREVTPRPKDSKPKPGGRNAPWDRKGRKRRQRH